MNRIRLPILIIAAAICWSGCAEGPLWQSGHYVPWAKNQWEQENQIAGTLQRRKRELDQLVSQATSEPEIQRVAEKLGEVSKRDSILLVRLYAVELLGKINHPTALEHLKNASQDADSRIRIAAVDALGAMPSKSAIAQLQEVLGSDTDVDVRLAATKALSNFKESSAMDALSVALSDPNPAIQFRAMESLERITGKKIGSNVAAWQNVLSNQNVTSVANTPATAGNPILR